MTVSRLHLIAAIGTFTLMVLWLSSACSGNAARPPSPTSPPPSEDLRVRRDEAKGGISVEAILMSTEEMGQRGHPPDHIGFLLKLDTHTGDLLGYNLVALSELRSAPQRAVAALGWEPFSQDSHHRSGLLYFPRNLPDGRSVIPEAVPYLELSLRGLGGVPERVLRWEMPGQGSP
jgi:hypothetical protein